tara:strand:+ start:196 stop:459 length:264 start_codon:yes stop_codon:yes gene_type:complete
MTANNVEETADIVSFHLEMEPKAPFIVVRATALGHSEEDIAAIAKNVLATTGVTVSGRFVPESEHGLVGESIIEFSQNNNNDTGGIK